MYYNSHRYNAMQFAKRWHFTHSSELRECSFSHSFLHETFAPPDHTSSGAR